MIYLDTHVVVWLYANDRQRLSQGVVRTIEREDLLVSPVVRLELAFLHEKGRITVPEDAILDDLAERIGLAECELPFQVVSSYAARQSWTRDPFDRFIVGQAVARAKPLLTRDRHILEHLESAMWPAN